MVDKDGFDVFVSYNRRDRQVVERLAQALRRFRETPTSHRRTPFCRASTM